MKDSHKDPLQRECRRLVNDLILKCNSMTPRVSSFKLINSDVIGSLYSNILRIKPFHSNQDDKHRYQNMIHHLSEVLNTEVNHLDPQGMASKDPKQLFFLLEILSTILESQRSPSITSSDVETLSDRTCVCTTCCHPPACAKCPPPLPRSSRRKPRDFSPESCCSCCSRSSPRPVSVSSCDCSDLDHSSNSCSCTCSNCLYQSSSSSTPPLLLDTKRFQDVLNRQREGRPISKYPRVVRHRTGRTPVRAAHRPHFPERKKSKVPDPPEDVKSLMAKYKLAKEDAFALELGYRLHEALKLEDETKRIEKQIDQFHKMKRSPSKSRDAVHVLTPSKTNAKSRSVSPKKTTPKKVSSPTKSPAKTYTMSPKPVGTSKSDNLNEIIKRSTSLESFLGKFAGDSFPPETRKKLKIMETKHNIMMNNLRNEMKNKESKSCLLLKEAIDTEAKKSDLLRKEIERLNHLKERKMNEIDLLDQNVAIKEYRSEKAKVQRMVQDYHREIASKFKAVQSKQEQLIIDEIEERMRQEKIEMFRMRNNLKEKDAKELTEKKKLLNAFDGIYKSKYDSVKDKLGQIETDTTIRRRDNNQLLSEIKKRLKHELITM